MKKPFDPVVIRETRNRMQKARFALINGVEAADALLWFNEHALNRDAADVFRMNPSMVASSTVHVDLALAYINQAAVEFKGQILLRAIAMAQQGFDAGSNAL